MADAHYFLCLLTLAMAFFPWGRGVCLSGGASYTTPIAAAAPPPRFPLLWEMQLNLEVFHRPRRDVCSRGRPSNAIPRARLASLSSRPVKVRRKPRSNLTGPKDTPQEDVEEVTFRGLDERGYENPL